MSDTSHAVWALQRMALMRARTVIFSGILDLGGPPTVLEEEHQLAEDARVAQRMTAELREVLGAAGADDILVGAFSPSQRDYWNARVPALLSFGARTHGELVRLAPGTSGDARATHAAAVFQLAASLLDWIGDEDAGAAEVIRCLPVPMLDCMVRDPRAARVLAARARREARPATAAFVQLLGILIDLVREMPGDTDRFFDQLAVAYGAELASFAPPSREDEVFDIASLKSSAPTSVVGELARLAATDDDTDIVGRAVATIAGIFGTIDDVADLSNDLRTGAVNTLVAAAMLGGGARDDAGVKGAMQTVLSTDLVEERSAAVVNAVHDLARMLDDARVAPVASAAALEWLRTTTWRWIA